MRRAELAEWQSTFEETGELPEHVIEELLAIAERALDEGFDDGEDEET